MPLAVYRQDFHLEMIMLYSCRITRFYLAVHFVGGVGKITNVDTLYTHE
jgi:hypothetical protein